jgi:hypothetical protein
MKKRLSIFASIFAIIILAGCTTTAATTQTSAPSQIPTVAVSETPLPITTPTPTLTQEPVPTVTPTLEPSATQQDLHIAYLSSKAQYQYSSAFTLYVSVPGGNYSATGTFTSGAADYQCNFDSIMANDLVCTGGPVPLNRTVYIQLVNTDTNQVVYNNTLQFAGFVPTPTGMDCQVEPQWNGYIPAHQGDKNCFAMTCLQNGKFFYGNNNTCENPWPFDWNFYHPLYTPPAP